MADFLRGFDQSAGMRCLRDRDDGAVLWLLDVFVMATQLDNAFAVLSAEERERAGRFRREEDRLRFGLTRAALRHLLGEATGRAPEDLAIAAGPLGKPCLACGTGPFFNVSHSGSFAMIGMSARRPIGVDIEWAREGLDELALAERFLTRREADRLAALEGAARRTSFYEIWTGKEAVLKALGVGISESLQDFTIEVARSGIGIVAETEKFTARAATLLVEPVRVPEGYVGAFALA